ncbi:uncharacterized protein VTP21DRAFT_7733 [Calcarisporiella thermophila]|uniref:uncharacterized protein n=1 Tax=Calcarisporiella thermophila TaxID=911321 RepID=UPI0037435355
MEGLPTIRDMIQPGDYLIKVDLSNAYLTIPVHPKSRQYLSFKHRGETYSFKAMPFGLASAPRTFSKLMKDVLEPLRKQGFRLTYYLDDICLMNQSEAQAKNQAKLLIEHLQALGFIINEKKSELMPKKQQIFLGFEINTMTMKIKLPKEKVARIRQDIRFAKTKPRTARQIASLAGLLASTAPAVRPAFIFQRHLQRDLAKHLQRTNQGWEKVIPLSKETIEDLKKWEILLDVHNCLQVRIPPLDETVNIMTDASGTGWGIVSTHLTTHGQWTDSEKKASSNQKELRAILFALKLHTRHWENKHIRIKTDNKIAVA